MQAVLEGVEPGHNRFKTWKELLSTRQEVHTMVSKKVNQKPLAKSELSTLLRKLDTQIAVINNQSQELLRELKEVNSEIDTIKEEKDSYTRKLDGQIMALSSKRRVIERMLESVDLELEKIRSEKDSIVRKHLM
jgi:chromosome segregation ATPase